MDGGTALAGVGDDAGHGEDTIGEREGRDQLGDLILHQITDLE